MELRKAVLDRRSIRKFLKQDVPEELLMDILTESQWAPSWGNTQPWEIMVLSGPPLAVFREKNREALFSGKTPDPEICMPEIFPSQLKRRYVDVGRRVFQSLSIERDDMDARLSYYGDMFRLFDAPVLILILLDKNVLLEYAMLDVGLFLQTLMLSAHGRGLGSATLAAAVNFPSILRSLFPIPDTKTIIMGTVLGWPDPDAPVNRFDRKRADLNEIMTRIQ